MLQLSRASLSFKRGDVEYSLEGYFDSYAATDDNAQHLVRAGDGLDATGAVYEEGLKNPKVITIVLTNPPDGIINILRDVRANRGERLDWTIIDRIDGRRRSLKECLIQKDPIQETMDGSAEEMNVSVILETFHRIEDK